jgi:hypothetical protein
VEETILPFARDHTLGILTYGSLAHGLLTGTWTADQTFDQGDWRRSGRHFGLSTWSPANLPANLAVVEKLRVCAEQAGKSVAQLAIAWILAHPAVTAALCGARTTREILEDIGGDWEMEPSLRREIDEIVLTGAAGVGRYGDQM